MKTKTSKLIVAALILSSIFFVASSFNKPASDGGYATMRTLEAAMGGSSISIVYEDGRTEQLDLDKIKAGNMLPNAVKINEAVNSLRKKGYTLVAVTGGDYISTYTFQKN